MLLLLRCSVGIGRVLEFDDSKEEEWILLGRCCTETEGFGVLGTVLDFILEILITQDLFCDIRENSSVEL